MNFKRLLAIVLIVTTVLPCTDVLQAMWRCRARRAPAAPAPVVHPVVHVHHHAVPAPAIGGSKMKLFGAVTVGATLGALITYVVLHQRIDMKLPDLCENVMAHNQTLLTNSIKLIQPCLNELYTLAQSTHTSLNSCEERVYELLLEVKRAIIREQEKCGAAAATIKNLVQRVAGLQVERNELHCVNLTSLVHNVTSTVSSWVPAWVPSWR